MRPAQRLRLVHCTQATALTVMPAPRSVRSVSGSFSTMTPSKTATTGLTTVACTLMAVYEGYHAQPTAEGVGLATTRTVIASSVLVLIFDYMLTAAFI